MSQLEEDVYWQLVGRALWGDGAEREYRFAKEIGRRWAFDFAWPKERVALEVEGGIWVNGRHTRGSGYEADIAKYNQAQLLGWLVLRATKGQIESGEALVQVAEALAQRREGAQGANHDAVRADGDAAERPEADRLPGGPAGKHRPGDAPRRPIPFPKRSRGRPPQGRGA